MDGIEVANKRMTRWVCVEEELVVKREWNEKLMGRWEICTLSHEVINFSVALSEEHKTSQQSWRTECKHTQVSCSVIKQHCRTCSQIKGCRQLRCRECWDHVYVLHACVHVCVWGYTLLCCWVTVSMTEQWDKSQKPLYHLFIALWLWDLQLLKAAWSQPSLTLSSLTSTKKYRDEVKLWRTIANVAINILIMQWLREQQICLWIAEKSCCICFASQSWGNRYRNCYNAQRHRL